MQQQDLDATEDAAVRLVDLRGWDDVVPILQDDGPGAVASIAYDGAFRETMDFFRAILDRDERSERALRLTRRVIALNPANYTAWHFRRLCLDATRADLEAELAFTADCAEASPKNYQIWYHRRALVERLRDGSREPLFVSGIFDKTDAKNYHAWAHRQWAVQEFHLWEGELEYADFMIRSDVRNNSAWNYRWFVVTRGGERLAALDDDAGGNIAQRELAYACDQAELAFANECPYVYIRAVLGRCTKPTSRLGGEVLFSWICNALTTTAAARVNAVPLKALYVDALVDLGRTSEAKAMCTQLAQTHDVIRKSYWQWREAQLTTTS